MRYLISVATLLLLAGNCLAQSPALSGNQIRKLFAGRTIIGTESGERYSETLLPDGALLGRSKSEGEYDGEWSVDGDELCFSYEDEEEDCSRVAVQGAKIIFIGDGEADTYATLK
ncbi:MAG: hypothetical protein INR68_17035 [Methylobacterium mesophilicum]|nr:hypothetical protein [Methylobacterium mesophilicum]